MAKRTKSKIGGGLTTPKEYRKDSLGGKLWNKNNVTGFHKKLSFSPLHNNTKNFKAGNMNRAHYYLTGWVDVGASSSAYGNPPAGW
tara:strand:- start:431 stop:688 length:258 start_codon:yes stop_codon:yes gene_type:complete